MMTRREIDFMSFEAFRDRMTGKDIDLRSNDEIIAELETLHGLKKGELLNGYI